MRNKEELIAEAMKEHVAEQERNFKGTIRNCISKIASHQAIIKQEQDRIKQQQKYIREFEMTPFDPTTIITQEEDA